MMADETNYRPLEGVKVLELSTMVAAGSCGRMLADWGATVIKVEAEKGDMFRNFPKTFLVPCTMDENPLFDNLNAGKRGIVLKGRYLVLPPFLTSKITYPLNSYNGTTVAEYLIHLLTPRLISIPFTDNFHQPLSLCKLVVFTYPHHRFNSSIFNHS